MYPDKMKYPDSMLVRHLEAQVDRILDYDFGSIVSDNEYRMIGKTKKIIEKIYNSIVKNGIESRESVVFVGSKVIQDLYVESIIKLIDSSIIPESEKDTYSKSQFKKIVIIASDDARGYKFDNKTSTVFVDGVTRRAYHYIVRPSIVSEDIAVRGFIAF